MASLLARTNLNRRLSAAARYAAWQREMNEREAALVAAIGVLLLLALLAAAGLAYYTYFVEPELRQKRLEEKWEKLQNSRVL